MDALKLQAPDNNRLQELYKRLEFRQLLRVKSEERRVKSEELRVKNNSNNMEDGGNSDSSLFTLHSSLSSLHPSPKNSDGSMQLDLFSMPMEPQHGKSRNQAHLTEQLGTPNSPTTYTSSANTTWEVDGDLVIGHNLKASWKELKAQGLTERPCSTPRLPTICCTPRCVTIRTISCRSITATTLWT